MASDCGVCGVTLKIETGLYNTYMFISIKEYNRVDSFLISRTISKTSCIEMEVYTSVDKKRLKK